MTLSRKRAGPAVIQLELPGKGVQQIVHEVLGGLPLIYNLPHLLV